MGDVEQTVQIHPQDLIPHLPGHFEKRTVARDAGVVHKDGNRPEVLHRLCDHRIHLVAGRHAGLIALGPHSLVTQQFLHLPRLLRGMRIVENHIRAGVRQCQCGRPTDAPCRACDQTNLPLQFFHSGLCFKFWKLLRLRKSCFLATIIHSGHRFFRPIDTLAVHRAFAAVRRRPDSHLRLASMRSDASPRPPRANH